MSNLEQIVNLQNNNMDLKCKLGKIKELEEYLEKKYNNLEETDNNAKDYGEVSFYDIKYIIKKINKIFK